MNIPLLTVTIQCPQIGERRHGSERKHACGNTHRPCSLWGTGSAEMAV